MNRKEPLVHLILIALIGILAYSNTFRVPFQFDDFFVNLRQVGDISRIPSLFTDIRIYFGSRPLLLATLGLNYYFGGANTWGYHAVNLALHLLNGALLYLLVAMTGRHLGFGEKDIRFAALFSSALFVLHPVQTEAVTYIISRSLLLATAFYLSGMILFLKAVTAKQKRGLWIAALFTASLLGMASREDFATFLPMLFLYDIFFVSKFKLRDAARHWKAYAPVILSLGYMFYIILNNTYNKSADQPGVGIPPLDYSLTQFRVHWTYLRLLILPVNQNLDYDYPISKTLFELPTLLSFIGYLGLWGIGIFLARKKPAVSFPVLWFLITLIPISFAVILTKVSLDYVISEHRLYLPAAGVFTAVACGGVWLLGRLNGTRFHKFAVASAVIVPLLLAPATFKRNAVWQSDLSLWEDSVKKSPYRANSHNNVGLAYQERGRIDKALEHFSVAIALDPEFAKAYNNRGLAYYKMGQFDLATANFSSAIKIDPRLAQAHNNLGIIYNSEGAYDKAVEQFVAALTLDPDYANAHNNLGVAYQKMGRFDMAIRHMNAAIELEPDSAMAYNNLGIVFFRMGQDDKAMQQFLTAIRLDPSYFEAYINLGTVLLSLGQRDEALRHFQKAVELRPDSALAHNKLGLAYKEMSLPEMAEEQFRIARELAQRK